MPDASFILILFCCQKIVYMREAKMGFGDEFPSRFGQQPNVSHKIKKKEVSEPSAKQPTIEMGLIGSVRI